MTFLNPAFLWAALFVAVPIIVHLFNFRKPKRVLFSNVAFVREVNQAVVQRLKLKQWLLLASRILAVLAVVAAFADPVIQNDNASGATTPQGNRSVTVLIDNSLSMSAADGGGEWLQQAKFLTREILAGYTESDEFQVQTTGQFRLNSAFVTLGQAQEQLEKVKFQDKPYGISALLGSLDALMSESVNQNRHIYFLSDYQRSTVLADSLRDFAVPAGYQVTFLPVGTRAPANVYVSDAKFLNNVPEVGRPVALELVVNNASEEDLQQVGVRVLVEGQEVSIGSVENVAQGSNARTQVTFTPQRGGWQSGEIVLDDPDVEFDNRRYFSFYIPENQSILLVQGTGEDGSYLKLLYENLLRQFRLKVISERELANQELSQYGVVVLAGPSNLGTGISQRLKSFMENGGGVLFFPSAEMDVPSINSFFAEAGLGQWSRLNESTDGVVLARPDLGHPIFQGVFETNQGPAEFDSPRLNRIFGFSPQNGGVQQTIMRDMQGRPFLHEAQVGNGRAFVFTAFPALRWGDLPLKSSFVPLVHRATMLLGYTSGQSFSQVIGRYELFKLRTRLEGQAVLKNAEGFTLVPEQYERGGSLMLKFDYMDIVPGNYGVYIQDSLLARLSFNLDDAESRLSVITPEELEDKLEEDGISGVRVVPSRPEQVRAAVQNAGDGTPIWKLFLIIAVLMLVAEVCILKWVR